MTRLLEPGGAGEPSESTEASRVLTRQGRQWREDRSAEVLLLGDSFTNIYSDATVGWGTGAGLAEQLSFELGRGIDRIAVNAGGSWSSRQALARAAGSAGAADPLAGKAVVVYQFATRELSQGDWKVLPIPSARREH
jgi:alginate O-acetyltransferase complex protein AlgJ